MYKIKNEKKEYYEQDCNRIEESSHLPPPLLVNPAHAGES